MSRLIDLGCNVADVYRRYHEVHGALFGAGSFRLIIDALLRRRQRAYRDHSRTLNGLRIELKKQQTAVLAFTGQKPGKATEREMQQLLLKYIRTLDRAILALIDIFINLEQNETTYRDTNPDGRSAFSRDKLKYDHKLSELERIGTRLNRLFHTY